MVIWLKMLLSDRFISWKRCSLKFSLLTKFDQFWPTLTKIMFWVYAKMLEEGVWGVPSPPAWNWKTFLTEDPRSCSSYQIDIISLNIYLNQSNIVHVVRAVCSESVQLTMKCWGNINGYRLVFRLHGFCLTIYQQKSSIRRLSIFQVQQVVRQLKSNWEMV